MGRYLVKRVVWAVAQLIAATLVLFVLFFVAPEADLSVSGSFAAGQAESRAGRFQETGSASGEYIRFLGHLVHGELGR